MPGTLTFGKCRGVDLVGWKSGGGQVFLFDLRQKDWELLPVAQTTSKKYQQS